MSQTRRRAVARLSAGGSTPRWHRRDPLFDVPLALPSRTAYRELEIEPDASDQEVQWARSLRLDRLKDEKRKLERRDGEAEPVAGERQRRLTEIDGEIHRLNALALDNPEKRREHDRRHPPLALLRLADATELGFLDDVRTMLFLLRRELAGFLADRGCEVLHPSDLTREDFSYEFVPNELLDGPLPEETS